jgi:hypothetical protein
VLLLVIFDCGVNIAGEVEADQLGEAAFISFTWIKVLVGAVNDAFLDEVVEV